MVYVGHCRLFHWDGEVGHKKKHYQAERRHRLARSVKENYASNVSQIAGNGTAQALLVASVNILYYEIARLTIYNSKKQKLEHRWCSGPYIVECYFMEVTMF